MNRILAMRIPKVLGVRRVGDVIQCGNRSRIKRDALLQLHQQPSVLIQGLLRRLP